MITVGPCRAFCSAAEQPERRNGVMARRPFGQQASYFVVNHAALSMKIRTLPKRAVDRFFKRFHQGSPSFCRSSRAAFNLGTGFLDWLTSCSTKAFQTRSDILSNFSFMSWGMKIPFFST